MTIGTPLKLTDYFCKCLRCGSHFVQEETSLRFAGGHCHICGPRAKVEVYEPCLTEETAYAWFSQGRARPPEQLENERLKSENAALRSQLEAADRRLAAKSSSELVPSKCKCFGCGSLFVQSEQRRPGSGLYRCPECGFRKMVETYGPCPTRAEADDWMSRASPP